jgi:hypothetical protein
MAKRGESFEQGARPDSGEKCSLVSAGENEMGRRNRFKSVAPTRFALEAIV